MKTPLNIALVGIEPTDLGCCLGHFRVFNDQQEMIDELKQSDSRHWPALILAAAGIDRPAYDELAGFLEGTESRVPLVVVDHKPSPERCQLARELGVVECLSAEMRKEDLLFKIGTVISAHQGRKMEPGKGKRYRIGALKRAFDILVSATLLLVLSPLFLVVAVLIRLESPGKVFYHQLRVGAGYRIFKFYKFRSMRKDADRLVKQLKAHNQYDDAQEPTNRRFQEKIHLFGDEGWVGENQYRQEVAEGNAKAFFKIKNDPRITRIGSFIRNTSIDELPQLFNVLIGDMSIVGNRPLPLYEAEKLTTDEWAMRFIAPAGITGLWQVTERGKANASADSRKQLDIEYARNHTFWGDIKILLKTPLAAVQHENV